jgi:Cu/Zn superoxide dismutase
MKRIFFPVAVAAVASFLVGGAAFAAHEGGTSRFTAEADTIAYNGDADAQATAKLTLQGNRLHVVVDASGVEPNKVHPQHIHGFGKGKNKERNATCPTGAQDDNGDGVVDVPEGLETYGQILLPLTDANGDFPVADADGTYHFEATYKIKRGRLTPLVNREIVIHGAVPPAKYTGEDPPPDQYWASLPVACGQIEKG